MHSLGDNAIGSDGAAAIVEALKANVVLTSLDLEYNQLDDAAKRSLRNAVAAGRDGFVLQL